MTAMRSKRLLTASGNNVVIANRNNQATQLWKFNSRTGTIESVAKRGLSMAMYRNGNNNRRGTNLILQRSNNRAWW